jgi:hypothetical protein
LLPVLERFKDIIVDYRIIAFEQAGSSFRLRAQIRLIDDSQLHVRDTVIAGEVRKYSFHWQDADGTLRVRWDNAPDWPLETFPHHRHVGPQGQVLPSYERTLEQVLASINEVLRPAT